MLYRLGSVTFKQTPLEVHDVAHETSSDYAPKDIIQNQRPREFMGEGDEHLKMIGTLFPTRIGGLSELAKLQEQRAKGLPWFLVRGDSTPMGFFYIERILEHDTFLNLQGIGRVREIEIHLVKAPDFSLTAGQRESAQITAQELLHA